MPHTHAKSVHVDAPARPPRPVRVIMHALAFAALIALPLLGAHLAGHDLTRYSGFPPPPPTTPPPGFSLIVFLGMTALVGLTVGPPLLFSLWCLRYSRTPARPAPIRWPWWGWLGLGIGIAAWLVSWAPIGALQSVRRHSFTPLWLGYVLVVNALTYRRTGSCLMLRHPLRWSLLFPLSGAFWWFFEFLNRFVQNWYYVGIDDLSPMGYILFATLPFATVLPAVLGTEEFLRTMPKLGVGLDTFIPLPIRRPRLIALLILLLAVASLLLMPLHPNQLYPLLWVSPLALLAATRSLTGAHTLFSPMAHGQWRRICLLALASLICGFFWEMWNMWSLAKWHYAVPYVSVMHIFEMPLLGFAGYLPFGLECALIADLILPHDTGTEHHACQSV
jgi:hypothetical protein